MNSWRAIQRKNFRKLDELYAYLEINDALFDPKFACNVPLRLAEKMEKGNRFDPLFLQFVPTCREEEIVPGFVADPVEDQSFCKTPRLIQKYRHRALLISTGACAMNCRFCFRQNFDYGADFSKELELIRSDESLDEVILSGGDPLALSDDRLQFLLNELSHLKLIRFHTRFPIGIPERITDELVDMLSEGPQKIFILHVNHPSELDDDVLTALKKLPIPVLTQSVLLKGVNDDLKTLRELFLKLVSHGLIPYYLHQLDRVEGAAHFEVEIEKGLALIEELKASLPGYAVPRYVQELPHKPSKTHIPNS